MIIKTCDIINGGSNKHNIREGALAHRTDYSETTQNTIQTAVEQITFRRAENRKAVDTRYIVNEAGDRRSTFPRELEQI